MSFPALPRSFFQCACASLGILAALLSGCQPGSGESAESPGAASATEHSSHGDGVTTEELPLAALARAAVCSSAPDAVGDVEHGYSVPSEGNGRLQSPIQIYSKECVPGEHDISLHYEASQEHILNRGHTVQVDYDPGSHVTFDGKVYDFLQFHFHTPSEHLVDGLTFPSEMHMVHKRRDDDENGVPHYLVIGVLFKIGEESLFLRKFIDLIPRSEHGEQHDQDALIDCKEILGEDWCNFYHYTGSLTTPPYTETVQWIVLRKVFEASHEQVEYLNRLEGNNARHVQASFGRPVEVYQRGQ